MTRIARQNHNTRHPRSEGVRLSEKKTLAGIAPFRSDGPARPREVRDRLRG